MSTLDQAPWYSPEAARLESEFETLAESLPPLATAFLIRARAEEERGRPGEAG